MLRIFTNLNKYGTLRNRIIHVPDGKPFTHGPNYGPIVGSRVFKYEYTGNISPALVTFNGKKYIIPSWQEVLPETTLNDIGLFNPAFRPMIFNVRFTYTSVNSGIAPLYFVIIL